MILSRNRRRIASGLFVVVGLTYPILVYLGLLYFSAMSVGLVAIGLLVLRLAFQPSRSRLGAFAPVLIAPACVIAALLPFDDVLAVKLYPVVISLSVAAAFGVSVMFPPTVVERIARVMEPKLNERGVRYARAVTLIWVATLVANAAISAWTAAYATLEIWTLYNGFLSYVFMGTVFALEFVNRQRVKSSHVTDAGEIGE